MKHQDDLQEITRAIFQKAANRFARRHRYGRATSFVFADIPEPKIGEASRYGWETKGGRPIHSPTAYSKKGWSNMRYIHAHCEVLLPRDPVTLQRFI